MMLCSDDIMAMMVLCNDEIMTVMMVCRDEITTVMMLCSDETAIVVAVMVMRLTAYAQRHSIGVMSTFPSYVPTFLAACCWCSW